MVTSNAAEDGVSKRRRKILDLVLSQVAPLAASSVMTFATAAILGAAGRGQLALILSGGALLGSIAFLSLHVGIVSAHRDGDPTATRRGWVIAGAIALIVAGAGLSVSVAFPTLKAGLFTRSTVLLIALGGAFVLFNLVVLRTRQGLGHSRIFRDSWFLQSITFPVLGIPVALLTDSPTLVAVCWYLALTLSTLYAMTKKMHHERAVSQISSRRIVATSLAAHAGSVGQQILFRGDVVVLGFLVSASSVGIYSIAMPIAGLIWVFSEALSLLAFDTGTRRESSLDRQRNRRNLVATNFKYGGLGAVLIAAGSWFLIPVFLPQYVDAIPLILILLPGVLIQGWARIGLSSILTTGSVGAPITIGALSALLSTLYIPFVVLWGVIGAAAASTLIYVLQTLVVAAVTRYVSKHL
ncbi:Membrane protein involved in the export of O-antigen and teichoic acid [Paramicrobacterium humi]|uniref:Membrane protein involved in the export of O-antigen and teichoic acid n=1 Tax=Paramicrobacterium humi TaxID=640635 RepID=A0A1H4NEE9_9MICO|nr:hypothetical protein [Microbacterium humi]SEB93561.1 Membrane protein involved in the export of O-antigen and teichoic acid [Microbacterium humi]